MKSNLIGRLLRWYYGCNAHCKSFSNCLTHNHQRNRNASRSGLLRYFGAGQKPHLGRANSVRADALQSGLGWHIDPHTFTNRGDPRAPLSRSGTVCKLIRPWEDIQTGKPHWPSGTGCSARSKLGQRRLLKVQNCEVLGVI